MTSPQMVVMTEQAVAHSTPRWTKEAMDTLRLAWPIALTQLGHVAGPGGEEHLAAYMAAAGDVVTEVMYDRFPGPR